jgi:hypothetical protein
MNHTVHWNQESSMKKISGKIAIAEMMILKSGE